ncbi:M48 family metalloprotease [Kordiimonas aestuarii]|uniref:M48 family metalloprotease n=1 Tax=Kordiimonas aestuarii TaxID=1005925 RepID=UPI0021D2E4FA|nr:M48 family metalloprotease [Kordiimonas aestuarii]
MTCKQILASVLMLLILPFSAARAQSILRDAETEAFLHEVSDPIFIAAGLNPKSVHLYLLHDNSINAFVTGGQNIFIHSGLILAANDVNEFLGVMAHETCHIACGHRVRTADAAGIAGTTSILSMVLGAAAILAGGADAGMGIMMAGQSMAQGQFLAYSRGQESEADLAGAKYLEKAHIPGEGMIAFFEKLRDQEILAQVRQDPYVRSHPLNRTRIMQLQEAVETSPYAGQAPDPVMNEKFNRLKAKLEGYLFEPRRTLRDYPLTDTSASGRYARVYAYHKALEWDAALKEADALIEMEPNNPYFYEIKGQILFENGHVDQSLPVFKKAVALAPKEPLISTALGQAMVSTEDDTLMAQAIPILEDATRQDRGNSFAWFNLAKAYAWVGREADASLATAERFYSAGAPMQAVMHAQRAMQAFDEGTPEWLRAQDILYVSEEAAEKMRKYQEKRRREQDRRRFEGAAFYGSPS